MTIFSMMSFSCEVLTVMEGGRGERGSGVRGEWIGTFGGWDVRERCIEGAERSGVDWVGRGLW